MDVTGDARAPQQVGGRQNILTPQKRMKETVDSQIIEQLDPIARKYEEAVNNNDAAAVAALSRRDAIFVTDSGPFMVWRRSRNFV